MTDVQMTTEQPAEVVNNDAPQGFDADAEMSKVWDRMMVINGADRGEGGQYVSPDGEAPPETPLEGGEGEGVAPVTADVPLPANWRGREDLWGKIPVELRSEIAEHQEKLHKTLSDQGSFIGQYKPIDAVVKEFGEYFDGRLKTDDGQPITPAAGMRYLFGIQRDMDRAPVETTLAIIDRYGIRDQLAQALGIKPAEGQQQPDQNTALQQTISRLESRIAELTDPRRIEQVVDEKTARVRHDEEVSRLTSAKPLYDRIPEQRMVFFINEAWQALGDDATKEQVLDHAYNAAIEADPALRALAKAAVTAAEDKAAKAEGAKKASSVNVKSTSAGKPRVLSEDEAMEAVWQKYH